MRKLWISNLLVVVMLLGVLVSTVGGLCFKADAVTASDKEYDVFMFGLNTFFCNKIPGSAAIGTEYFMKYTVKSARDVPIQHGLVGTDDPTQGFPYENGGLFRGSNDAMHMLDVGATYYIRFEVAEGGFHYNITREKDGKLEDLYMDSYYGEATDKMQYFGVWFGASSMYAEFTNVRCYDANGKDLGIQILGDRGCVVDRSVVLAKDQELSRYYSIQVNDQYNISISHLRAPTTEDVYLEYTVESGDYFFNQLGMGLSNSPDTETPHGERGHLKLNSYENGSSEIDLLEPGASYIFRMIRNEKNFDVVVQKTKGDNREIIGLKEWYGPDFDPESAFYYLWFGYEAHMKGSFTLTNVKFYDGNKNDLGIQCSKPAVITQYGEVPDYAGCEATYYCRETEASMALYADQTVKLLENGQTKEGTYQVADNVMTVTYGTDEVEYDYLYNRITNKEGHVFHRLYTYKVSFVTGTSGEIPAQVLSPKTGYYAMKPTDPVKDGRLFEGWYTSNGMLFDFDHIVTESVSLYAKFQGEDVFTEPANEKNSQWIVFGCGVAVLAAGVVALILIRGRKHVKEKE